MKKNGFAISGILYPMLILFLCFILLIMGNLAESHYRLRRLTSDIMTEVNGEDEKSQFKRRVENLLKAGNSCINYGVKEGKIRPSFSYGEDINDLTGRFYTMADGRTAALIDDGKYCAYKLTNYQSLRVQESGTCNTSILSNDCTGAGLVCPPSSSFNVLESVTTPTTAGNIGDGIIVTDNKMTGFFVSNVEPTNKEEGFVWIKVNVSSPYQLISDGIALPISEAFQYLNGGWVKKPFYIYQNDKWNLVGVENYVYEYSYTGDYQTFVAPVEGNYKIELWGSQGGDAISPAYAGGKGAYTAGTIYLSAGETLYVYVGERYTIPSSSGSGYARTSFNGGGAAYQYSTYQMGNGGGATDVRLVSGNWDNQTSLASRIMVASGGGGGSYAGAGAYGGALTGAGTTGSQASQIAGGKPASKDNTGSPGGFGYGGAGGKEAVGAGGGGYYGGAGASQSNGYNPGGASGSSYISGHAGSIGIISATNIAPKVSSYTQLSDSYHYSGKVFTSTLMYDGNTNMPTYTGTSTMKGNAGHGHAKISLIP